VLLLLALLVSGGLPTLTGWAQDSGAASFTVASANGNVVVKRANGSAEMVTSGTMLYANDQLASVGHSDATLRTGSSQGGTAGASLMVYSDTTLGIRSSGSGGFYVADIAQGVVLGRSAPGSNTTLQITNETAGAVAQLNPGGGMAVASDVGTGTIAVACDDRASQVFFPYVDSRVPCENNVVRTLSNQRTVDDDQADSSSPVTSAVQAAGTNVAEQHQQDNQQATTQHTTAQQQDKDNVAPVVVASPSTGTSPNPPSPPVSFVFSGTCTNNFSNFTSACTISATGLTGAQVGGNVAIQAQTLDSLGRPTTDNHTCGPITSALTVSCNYVASGVVFQGSVFTFTTPLAAGGSSIVSETLSCVPSQSPGTACGAPTPASTPASDSTDSGVGRL
jgi:hypothetical protein